MADVRENTHKTLLERGHNGHKRGTKRSQMVTNGHKWSQMVRIRNKKQVLAVANVGDRARNTHNTLLKKGHTNHTCGTKLSQMVTDRHTPQKSSLMSQILIPGGDTYSATPAKPKSQSARSRMSADVRETHSHTKRHMRAVTTITNTAPNCQRKPVDKSHETCPLNHMPLR